MALKHQGEIAETSLERRVHSAINKSGRKKAHTQKPNEQKCKAPVPRNLTLLVEEADKQMESVIICCCSATKFVSDSSVTDGLQPSRLLCPCHFPGKNTGLRGRFLLQGIFLTH